MAELRADGLVVPLSERLASTHRCFDEIIQRHAAACALGESTYADPTSGLSVFTACFLADRGYCCTSGCRHCPFEV